jgi:small conductance mechanosensitive channel
MDIVEQFFGTFTWQTIITTSLRITMILVLAWIGMKILKKLVDRMENNLLRQSIIEGEPPSESQKRIETITRLVKQGCLLALWLTVSMVILRELGVEIGPIIASAGIVGLAVGFGAQNLVRDIISGFFIILENQIRVGDVAVINDTGGLVEKINFRTTVLRDLSGVVHIFPNGSIQKLSNMTNEWSAYVFDIGVAYKEDTDTVIGIMKAVGATMLGEARYKAMMLGEPEIFGVDRFADSAVIIKGRLKTKPIRQWDVGREFLRRIKLAFDANGIEIPYPHRSIFLDQAALPLAAKLVDRFRAGSTDMQNPHTANPDALSDAPAQK